MDNYPEELTPELGVDDAKTPFEEWWPTVRASFPNVPENVAEQWLHRHWGYSPYRWLPSRSYTFRLVEWECSRLAEIQSGTSDWDFAKAVEHGNYILRRVPDLWLARYMVEHEDVPEPIIVLDNRDGSLNATHGAPWQCPSGFLLIEGHKRFELAAYMFSVGRLKPSIRVWLMEKTGEPQNSPT